MKHLLSILTLSLLTACGGAPETNNVNEPNSITMTESKKATISYPQTVKGDVVDNYFGQHVADPYRWLEDDRSSETEAWVKAQNQVTFDYLAQIPYRAAVREKLQQSWNFERVGGAV